MNTTFQHIQSSISSKTIYIVWPPTQSETDARRSNAGNWTPNHFVPLLLPSSESQNKNNLTEPKATGSGLTRTKSTTKNNVLTQIRIPGFNAEDDEIQQFQTLSAYSTVSQEIAKTPQTKRRLQAKETYTSVENTNIGKGRLQACQRMAAKRTQATPEEAERQRMLARKRSAASRAALTPEQVEYDRSVARDRSAARRSALTLEEMEKQREQTREKVAAWRATLTQKEIQLQRTLVTERTMSKRAAASPKETEEQHVVARKRSAARRTAYTSDELEQQRAFARQR
ncbi:unnamed protein product [Rotaria sp. Silwood2]|nr:unnamed protein product [Rotaria sp. Silwood2]